MTNFLTNEVITGDDGTKAVAKIHTATLPDGSKLVQVYGTPQTEVQINNAIAALQADLALLTA